MKRVVIMITCILTCLSAYAQKDSLILNTSDHKMSRGGDVMTVSFSAKAGEDCVRNNYSLFITPVIHNGDSTVRLTPFTISGKTAAKKDDQKRLLMGKKGRKDTTARYGNGSIITYVDSLDYGLWMSREVTLSMSTRVIGCCSTSDMGSRAIASFPVAPPFEAASPRIDSLRSGIADLKPDYPFLRKVGEDSIPDRGSSIRYRVAKAELDPEFSSNSKTLEEILTAVRKVKNDTLARFISIDIVGYASPEGNTRQNRELSEGRARSLMQYIMEQEDVPEEMFNITAGGEDWMGLRELVNESEMNYKDEIIRIIDNVPAAERQSRLKALAGGRPYKSIFDVLYPQLRDACYINVWYDEVPDPAARAINEAVALLDAGRPQEALDTLAPYIDDPRGWNTAGAARMMMEEWYEAMTWFEKAAANGDKDAEANLNRLKKYYDNENKKNR